MKKQSKLFHWVEETHEIYLFIILTDVRSPLSKFRVHFLLYNECGVRNEGKSRCARVSELIDVTLNPQRLISYLKKLFLARHISNRLQILIRSKSLHTTLLFHKLRKKHSFRENSMTNQHCKQYTNIKHYKSIKKTVTLFVIIIQLLIIILTINLLSLNNLYYFNHGSMFNITRIELIIYRFRCTPSHSFHPVVFGLRIYL